MQVTKKTTLLSFVTISAATMSLSACMSIPNVIEIPDGQYGKVFNYIPYAATTPLRDLNITQAPIPSQLDTLSNPYGTDTHISCGAVLAEAQALNAAITDNLPKNPGSRHDKNTRAGNLGNAMDAGVKAISISPIPFRGVVRFLSGATYHERDIMRADQKGRERLGFLIGIGAANRCPGFNLEAIPLR
ncbi:MAG: hypothetical protein ACPGVT_09685 [Maricaulaceae bacterium]